MGYMGLRETSEHMSYYATLKPHEKARMQPCKRAKCVMTSSESVPTLHASLAPTGFDALDDASRPADVSPATTTTTTTTTLSMNPLKLEKDRRPEAIEEEVTIGKTTLPTPEPRPKLQKNGYDVDTDAATDATDSLRPRAEKPRKKAHENDECLIGCIYVAQQCCECTIS